MKAWKTSLASLVVLAGFAASAHAQEGNAPNRGYARYPGAGTNGDYYSITNSFGPYGLPGTYPRYQGHGLSGYGPGAILNEYFVPWPGQKIPQPTAVTPPTSQPIDAKSKAFSSPKKSTATKRTATTAPARNRS